MFLFQKFNYKHVHLGKSATNEDAERMICDFISKGNRKIVTFDTETTGLNFMKDTPFLFIFGWIYENTNEPYKGEVYTIDIRNNKESVQKVLNIFRKIKYAFAHNTKYDYHMLTNIDLDLSGINFADGMTIARLTSYADEPINIGLEDLGKLYVDIDSKFAGKAIRELMQRIKSVRWNAMKKKLKEILPKDISVIDVTKAWEKRVNFINNQYDEYFQFIEENFTQPTYEDVYIENENLMVCYAADDVVVLLEYLEKAFPVLEKSYDLENANVFNQECQLIEVVASMERNGMKADINYLIASRIRVKQYIDEVYSELWDLTKRKYGTFSSGQHKVIMQIMFDEYNISMDNCDVQALTTIVEKHEGEPSIIASLIIELRTLDKWLSTYIEGMLNRVDNGRIYTNINNSGAVTGRVSSDMQQQPSEPLLNKKGDELFHPRKVFVNDDNSTTYYFDFSQMELRLQANYTIDISGGDKNLCRAFIPFGCVSIFTNKKYRLGDENWGSGEWVDEDDNEWTPVDLHSITTLKAFPHLKDVDKHSPEFKHHRRLGKMCNFLKNYGGGTEAIKSQLGVTDEVANLLNRGYYEAFPEILSYQKWVEDQLSVYGYVSNIYGRKYYIQDRRLFYKAYNYLIQGGCADLVKEKEINLYRYFKENNIKSKILLPIHDELQVSIINGEEWLIPKIKEIMDDNKNVVKHIPMLCDIEFTKTNWAEKEDY